MTELEGIKTSALIEELGRRVAEDERHTAIITRPKHKLDDNYPNFVNLIYEKYEHTKDVPDVLDNFHTGVSWRALEIIEEFIREHKDD